MARARRDNRAQLAVIVAAVTILTHFLSLIQPSLAANGAGGQGSSSSGNSEAASATQPLWSYQVKPTANFMSAQSAQTGHYVAPPSSLFDAFTGLSQRQGALTSSPFMSILPIILIAAGGLLLLLPMLTMMMASPFGGSPFGGGAYGGGPFGYPQVGALSKRRSLDQHQQQRGLIELIEHVSTTIEDLSRRYAPSAAAAGGSNAGGATPSAHQQQPAHKRAKALNAGGQLPAAAATNEAPQVQQQAPPANHRPADEATSVLSNVVGASGL